MPFGKQSKVRQSIVLKVKAEVQILVGRSSCDVSNESEKMTGKNGSAKPFLSSKSASAAFSSQPTRIRDMMSEVCGGNATLEGRKVVIRSCASGSTAM